MDPFIDPPNSEEVIDKALKIKEPDKIQAYIEEIYPGWLVFSLNKYSDDYPHLRHNWEKICELSKVEPQKIVLVSDIKFDDEHKVTRAFCEYMTSNGYVVRRAGEFIACQNCLAAIPSKDIWHLLKEKNLPVPDTWSNKCSNC